MCPNENNQFETEIRRGRLDTLSIYEISESELNTLGGGSPNSIYLNFAILTLTFGVSFLIAILTTVIESDRLFYTFVILSIIGMGSSIILFVLWRKTYAPISKLVKTIRERIPPQGEAESMDD